MLFPQKVLLATDGSGDAALAATAAIDLTTKTGSELHIVHAWHSVPSTRFESFIRTQLKLEARQLLATEVARMKEAGAQVACAYLREGSAVDEVLDLAEERDEGEQTLLAVGSRGLGPIQRARLGSVSTKILRAAKGPVLVSPGQLGPGKLQG